MDRRNKTIIKGIRSTIIEDRAVKKKLPSLREMIKPTSIELKLSGKNVRLPSRRMKKSMSFYRPKKERI